MIQKKTPFVYLQAAVGERGSTDSQWIVAVDRNGIHSLLCRSGLWWCYWAGSVKNRVCEAPLLGRVANRFCEYLNNQCSNQESDKRR